jgi:hypothetical protein
MLMLAVPLLAAAGLTLGAPALDARQEAHADQWQYFLGTQGAYCEGCCRTGFCCTINAPCRVTAPEDPAGGG